jgi:hypothetical protein
LSFHPLFGILAQAILILHLWEVKKNILAFVFILFAVANVLGQTNAKIVAPRVQENLFLLKTEKYSSLMQRMDPTMKRMVDAEKLEGLWESLKMQYGNVIKIGTTEVKIKDTLYSTLTPISFEKAELGFRMVLDQQLLIAGLFLEPLVKDYSPPSWINAQGFYEVKKFVPTKAFPSEALLTLPNGASKSPVMVIIGGSGPTDKNLSMGPNRIYQDIAWGLGMYGVASYRYDKRTRAFAAHMGNPDKITVAEEYLEDVKNIVAWLKQREDIDSNRIFLFGHSEGGYLIPWFCSEIPGLAGVIIGAGNYQRLADMLPYQLNYLLKLSDDDAPEKLLLEKELSKIPYAQKKLKKDSPKDSLPLGMSAAYLMYLNAKAPANYLKALQPYPVLVVQGGRDYQVPVSEFELWKKNLASHKSADFIKYPALNHVFISGENPSIPQEYTEPGHVSKTFIEDLAKWINAK